MIGLFYDKDELEEEIRKFIVTAAEMASRNYRVEFALLTDPKELKKAK